MSRLFTTILVVLIGMAPDQSVRILVRTGQRMPPSGGGGSFTAATCNRADVNAVINGPTHTAVNGDVINIPAGSCTWTTGITVASGIGITIMGSGTPTSSAVVTGADASCTATTITHNVAGQYLFILQPTTSSSLMRASCMKITTGLGANGIQSAFGVQGVCTTTTCPNVRLDNITFDGALQGKISNSDTVIVSDNVFGVFDHNTMTATTTGGLWEFVNYNNSAWQGVGTYGDKSWAVAGSEGTDQTLFIENNAFTDAFSHQIVPGETESAVPNGGWGGGRIASRYNACDGCYTGMSNHGTESAGRNRGGRQIEYYNNTMVCNGTCGGGNGVGPRSGTAILFNNSFTTANGGFFNGYLSFRNYRDARPFNPWGVCDGSSAYDNNDGTVYVSGTFTAVAGQVVTDNTKSWTTNQWSPSGAPYSIHDVTANIGSQITSNTATTATVALDFTGNPPAFVNGDSYQILRASACIDQPNRGAGTLYASATPSPASAANQTLSPAYEFNNSGYNPSGFGQVNTGPETLQLVANRDWYTDKSAGTPHPQTSATAPFNGTTTCNAGAGNYTCGMGLGLLARIPTTCTAGLAYWATDTNGLYKCVSTNVWSWIYSPYTYPHPNLGALPVNNYATRFALTEDPIAEPIIGQASVWTGGASANASFWANVKTTAAMAFGAGGAIPTLYGDPTALLKGTWAADQGAQATVHIASAPAVDSEVEIRLRSVISANSITGYEVYCNTRSANPYCHIATWGGPNGCYDNFEPSTPSIALVDGDTLSATVTGTSPVIIKLYVNGILQATATDSGTHTSEAGAACQGAGGASFTWGPWTSGNPGIGFWDGGDSNWSRFGFSKFSAFGQ